MGANQIRCFNHMMHFKEEDVEIGEKQSEGEIYVGGNESCDAETVKEIGYTHIIHIVRPRTDDLSEVEELNLYEENIDENCSTNILKFLPQCFKFIESAFEKNKNAKVLIHCLAGISRSSSVCIAYIMWKKKIGFRKVLRAAMKDRKMIDPNLSFASLLVMYEWNKFQLDDKILEMGDILCKDENYRNSQLDESDFKEIEEIWEKNMKKR